MAIAGFQIYVANPQKSHHYSKLLGVSNKTDKSAAKTLVSMCQNLDLPLYEMPSEVIDKRKQIFVAYNALIKQRQMIENQLHAIDQKVNPLSAAVDALQSVLDVVNQQIEQLQQSLIDIEDEQMQELTELAISVVGIGKKTATLLLLFTNGLKNFDTAAKLAKFIGLTPNSHRSGSSVYKSGRISKQGPTQLRAILYMAARSAKRYNNACKAIYQRLRQKGKCHRVAMIAVCHKLVKQVFAVIKSGEEFDNDLYLHLQEK